jgi:serine/threonine protein kinase
MAGDGFPPRELAEYRIVRLLGQGGNGRVYLAEDTVLRRPVAIKFMARDDCKARERSLVEARAAARLQHPNVAQIYRVGELDSRPYLVSEYVQGASLEVATRTCARFSTGCEPGRWCFWPVIRESASRRSRACRQAAALSGRLEICVMLPPILICSKARNR